MDPHDPDGSPDDPARSPRPEPEGRAPGTPFSPPPPGPPPATPPGAPGGAWTPPDAATSAAGPIGGSGIDIEVEDADGPPVPPPVRRRRRRRRALFIGAIVVAVVVVIGVPLGLVAGLLSGGEEEPTATAGDTPDDEIDDGGNDGGEGQDGEGEGGDAAGDEPGPLGSLDLDALDGVDAVYGRLLVDIDASEQVMIGFQDELATAFATPPDARVEALQETAVASRDDLRAARDRLDGELEVAGAEEVRERYLAHLDSWAEYMDAVAEDPGILGGEGAGAGFTVVINATADAFARALEDELPDGADPSVREYAENLLDRGFRPSADAQV